MLREIQQNNKILNKNQIDFKLFLMKLKQTKQSEN